jgi:hypothetical protein
MTVPAAIVVPPAHGVQFEASATLTDVRVTSTGITLVGTTTNTGTDPLYRSQVVLWIDTDPLTTPSQLALALASDPELDTGNRILSPSAMVELTTSDATFAAGATSGFTVSATWKELGITQDATYLAGVHIRGSEARNGSPVTIGRGRTLVTHTTTPQVSQALVVLFTSPPSLLNESVFTDDHLAEELAGRLATLLTLAEKKNATWVIDPRLLLEVTIMAQGYSVWDGTTTIEGEGSPLAQEWLDRFNNLSEDLGCRLPWSDPDLSLGFTSGTDVVTPALSAEQANPHLEDLPLLIRPRNGQISDDFLQYVTDLHPDYVLGSTPTSMVWESGVLLDTMINPFPPGPGPGPADTRTQRIQRATAESAVSPTPLIRVIQTAEEAAMTLPSWVTTVPLSSLTTQEPWSPHRLTGDVEGTLSKEILASLATAQATVNRYADLIGDDEAAQVLTTVPIASIISQSWSGDEPAAHYAQAVDTWLREIMSLVTISAPSQVSLTSRTSIIPVTIANGLSVPVSIRVSARVVAVPTSPALVSVIPSEVIQVGPGDRLSIHLSSRILREGEVDAVLNLTSPSGTPLESEATVRISARASAWMGWLVMGSAFILFVAGTFLRVRTAKKARQEEETSE